MGRAGDGLGPGRPGAADDGQGIAHDQGGVGCDEVVGGGNGRFCRVEQRGNAGQCVPGPDSVNSSNRVPRAAGNDQWLSHVKQRVFGQVVERLQFGNRHAVIGGDDGQVFSILNGVDEGDGNGRVRCQRGRTLLRPCR